MISNLQRKKVRLIVLTYDHIDHAENAAYLSNRLQVPIAIHPEEMELIETPQAQTLHSNGMMGTILLRMSNCNQNIRVTPFTPTVLLRDNDTLKKFGINATIIHLSGHTNGSIEKRKQNNQNGKDNTVNPTACGKGIKVAFPESFTYRVTQENLNGTWN